MVRKETGSVSLTLPAENTNPPPSIPSPPCPGQGRKRGAGRQAGASRDGRGRQAKIIGAGRRDGASDVTRQRFAEAIVRTRLARQIQDESLSELDPELFPQDSSRFRRRHRAGIPWADEFSEDDIAEEARGIQRRLNRSGARHG